MHKGKAKSPRKEVIDETDETIDEVDLNEEPVSAVVTDKTKKTADEILKSLADIDKLQFKNLEEDELEDKKLDSQTINGITDKYNNIYKKQGNVTNQDIEGIADQYPFDEKSSIIDYLNGYDPGLEFDI